MGEAEEEIVVVDNPAEHRFEAKVEGRLAIAEYMRYDSTIVFTHTEVPKEVQRRGVATALARGALEQARAQNLRVVARCQFIKRFIERHPEYQALLGAGS